MNRTERIEEPLIEAVLEEERQSNNETTVFTKVVMEGLEQGVISEEQLLALDSIREQLD